MSDLRQKSFAWLRARWHHLSIECWNYEAVDNYWHEMMGEKLEIEEELELRGYRLCLTTNQWYDAIRY